MAHRGGKEPSPWSEWAWVEEEQSYKSEQKDRRGNVVNVRWWSEPATSANIEPRYTSQGGPLPTRQYEELPSMTNSMTPSYAFGTSTAQMTSGYLHSSTRLTPQYPNPSTAQTAPSGYQRPLPTPTGQPISFTYGAAPVQPTSLSNYPTTPSGWPAPLGYRQQNPTQTPQDASAYYQGEYDESMRRKASPGSQQQSGASYGEASRFSSQDLALRNSTIPPRSYLQPGVQGEQRQSSAYGDVVPTRPMTSTRHSRQYGAPLGEATASGNQNEYSGSGGQTAPSGFGINTMADRSTYSPRATYDRPQSMYVSYGTRQDSRVPPSQAEGPALFRDEPVGETTREISDSTLRGQPHRRPVVYQDQERFNSRRDESYKASKFSSGVPNTDSDTSAVYDEDSGGDVMKHTAKVLSRSRSRRRSSVVDRSGNHSSATIRETRKSMSYQDDPVAGVTREMAKSSLRNPSRSGKRSSVVDPIEIDPTPREDSQEEPQSDFEATKAIYERFTQPQDPKFDTPRVFQGSAMPRGGDSVAHLPKEIPPIQRSSRKHQDTNKDYIKGSGRSQGQSQSPEWDKAPSGNPSHKQPKTLYSSSAPRKITTKDTQTYSGHLHEDFRVHKSKHFTNGAVFKVLWSEPCGDKNTQNASVVTQDDEGCFEDARYGEVAYHSTRRFVVVKERQGHSICVPILTYGRQGTNKPGVKAEYHAIIYTGETAPRPLPGEKGIHKRSVRVDNKDARERLAPESRVNYSKLYTVEHNVKVCFIGKIHKNSEATFFEDFKLIDS